MTIMLYSRTKTWSNVEYSSVQSLDRLGRRGNTRDDSAEILFQSFLQEALVSSSGMGRDVHMWMLSIRHFLCRPRRRPPSSVLWRMNLERLSWRATCLIHARQPLQNHSSGHHEVGLQLVRLLLEKGVNPAAIDVLSKKAVDYVAPRSPISNMLLKSLGEYSGNVPLHSPISNMLLKSLRPSPRQCTSPQSYQQHAAQITQIIAQAMYLSTKSPKSVKQQQKFFLICHLFLSLGVIMNACSVGLVGQAK